MWINLGFPLRRTDHVSTHRALHVHKNYLSIEIFADILYYYKIPFILICKLELFDFD